MDPLEEQICRLCLCDENSLTDIFNDSATNIVDILNKHIGTVSQ